MPRLRHLELKTLSEALLELYSPEAYVDLPGRMFFTLRRCLSFDLFGFSEILDSQNERSIIYPKNGLTLQAFAAYLDQHPSWHAIFRDQIDSSVKISDFASLLEWQHTDLYNYCFRPNGLNRQLAFMMLDQRPQLGIALNRSQRDFSEEDRSILDLLKPHFAQVYQTSRLFSHLSVAAESNSQAWIVTDNTGRILFETGKAIDLLKEYFGHNGSLPGTSSRLAEASRPRTGG
jgi:hypothetical protein